MIRFHCPFCNRALKVAGGKAGVTIVCPRCKEQVTVPQGALKTEVESRTAAQPHQEHEPEPLAGESRVSRAVVALVAGVVVVSGVLVIVVPAQAMILIPCFVVVLLILLHGYGTSCPSCGKWWVRRQIETEFVDRQVFHKQDTPYARATYRTNYQCKSCRYPWSVTRTEEYKDFIRERGRPRQRLG
jgi:phage FluMu protein Com